LTVVIKEILRVAGAPTPPRRRNTHRRVSRSFIVWRIPVLWPTCQGRAASWVNSRHRMRVGVSRSARNSWRSSLLTDFEVVAVEWVGGWAGGRARRRVGDTLRLLALKIATVISPSSSLTRMRALSNPSESEPAPHRGVTKACVDARLQLSHEVMECVALRRRGLVGHGFPHPPQRILLAANPCR